MLDDEIHEDGKKRMNYSCRRSQFEHAKKTLTEYKPWTTTRGFQLEWWLAIIEQGAQYIPLTFVPLPVVHTKIWRRLLKGGSRPRPIHSIRNCRWPPHSCFLERFRKLFPTSRKGLSVPVSLKKSKTWKREKLDLSLTNPTTCTIQTLLSHLLPELS